MKNTDNIPALQQPKTAATTNPESYVFNVTLDPSMDSLDASIIANQLREVGGVASVIVSVTDGAGKALIDGPDQLGRVTWDDNWQGAF